MTSEFQGTLDDLLSKHKKEQRDLISQITSLKKQASKKTRKSVNSKCEELQYQLDQRHKQELAEFNGEKLDDNSVEIDPELLLNLTIQDTPKEVVADSSQEATTKPKRNRQKERLARRNAEIEAIKLQASKEAENEIDYRKIEQESMQQILSLQNLTVYDIRPDGHCLFASIQDQLIQRHQLNEISISQLRQQAASQILENRDEYIPFLFDAETMQIRDVDKYCEELVNTAMWGSDLEIKALASVYNCPIKVFSAGASPIEFNEHGDKPDLKVGFYKHSYGLGEHYNSLRDSSP